jgi:glutamate racemase
MKDRQVIGIFDSGFGGLTVAKEIIKALPHENIIYFGDTARVPYGNKSKKVVTKFSKENTEFLLKFNIKAVVVACNTSCSLSIDFLRKKYKIPIIGVVEPAINKAASNTRNFKVGVIGTTSTIKSNSYIKKLKKKNPQIAVYVKDCPLFVPLVEENWTTGPITLSIAHKYLNFLKKKKIDTLILGCTHYPLLINTIQKVMGGRVSLINSAKEVAQDLKIILEKNNIFNRQKSRGKIRFFVSDEPERFKKLGANFLNSPIENVRKVKKWPIG